MATHPTLIERQVRARPRMIPGDGHEKEFDPWSFWSSCSQINMEGKPFNAVCSAGSPLSCCQLRTRPSAFLTSIKDAHGSWRIGTRLCPKIASFKRRDLVHKGHGLGCRGHRGSTEQLAMPHELSDKCAPVSPHCPACAQVMRLARITSRFGDLPDVYTFECRACGVSHIEPGLSASIAGALQLGARRKDLWMLATSETYDA